MNHETRNAPLFGENVEPLGHKLGNFGKCMAIPSLYLPIIADRFKPTEETQA